MLLTNYHFFPSCLGQWREGILTSGFEKDCTSLRLACLKGTWGPGRTTVIHSSNKVYRMQVHLPTNPQQPIRAKANCLILSNDTGISRATTKLTHDVSGSRDSLSVKEQFVSLTWLRLGWEECRLWVQNEWLDMVHEENGLVWNSWHEQYSKTLSILNYVTTCVDEQPTLVIKLRVYRFRLHHFCLFPWNTVSTEYLHLSHLLGELSDASIDEPVGSESSCCPGNVRCSAPHNSCSWPSSRRCDLFTSRRLRGDFPCRSLCLGGRADAVQFALLSVFLLGLLSSTPSILQGRKSSYRVQPSKYKDLSKFVS